MENRYSEISLKTYMEYVKTLNQEFNASTYASHMFKFGDQLDKLAEADPLGKNTESIYNSVIDHLTWYYRSTLIHVEDSNLINLLMNAKLDSLLCDVRMPFPVVEFAFPAGIPLGYKDYEVSGFYLTDHAKVDFNNFMPPEIHNRHRLAEMNKNVIGFNLATKRFNRPIFDKKLESKIPLVKTGMGNIVAYHSSNTYWSWTFSKDHTIEHNTATMRDRIKNSDTDENTKDGDEVVYRHFLLGMGLLMYCQSQQDKKALVPMTEKPPKGIGMCESMRARDKKLKHFKIINLIPKERFLKNPNQGGTHASPVVHPRGWVFRTLRHEIYSRNPDGSYKTLMVAPCVVGLGSKPERVNAERILA